MALLTGGCLANARQPGSESDYLSIVPRDWTLSPENPETHERRFVSPSGDAWMSLYANHAALRTGLAFLHVGGLVAGGGCAIAADRMILRATGDDVAERRIQLGFLYGTHLIVVIGLSAVLASGVLLFAADVETFLYSRLFWVKMGLVALLLVNGAAMLRVERRLGDAPGAWSRLAFFSRASLTLWFLTTLAGAALPNIG